MQSAGEAPAPPSPESFAVAAEEVSVSDGCAASEEPKSSSSEAGVEAGCGEEDIADAGLPQGAEGVIQCHSTMLPSFFWHDAR